MKRSTHTVYPIANEKVPYSVSRKKQKGSTLPHALYPLPTQCDTVSTLKVAFLL